MYLLIYRGGKHLFSFYINSAKKKIKIGGSDGDILFPAEMKGYEIILRKEFDFKEKDYRWVLFPLSPGFKHGDRAVEDGDLFSTDRVLSVKDFSFSLSYNSNISYANLYNEGARRGGTLIVDESAEETTSVLFEYDGKKKRFAFNEGKEIRLGRKKADLTVPHPEVSQEHMLFNFTKDGVVVWNKGKNGTFVNGVKIENCVLREGKYQFSVAGRYSLLVTLEKEGVSESFYKGSLVPYFERVERWINQPEIFRSHPIVMINGESGVGKEVFAEFAHSISNRKGDFVTFNAAAIPGELAESELFGTSKGGFTGAEDRDGAFLMADNGTLFLDEIGEMPLALQSKLLRVLEEWRIRKVGQEGEGKRVDIMLVVATNRDLQAEIAAGRFRKDLYYRLSTLSVTIPPLRDRVEDILPLASHLIFSLCGRNVEFTEEAIRLMKQYEWPGNVRELKSVMTKFAYMNKTVFEASDFDVV